MKFSSRISLPILLAVISFTSCKKHPEIPDPGEVKSCRITNFAYEYPMYRDTLRGTVDYNSAGNPTRVLIDKVRTGDPNALFIYDKFNRLTDHIGSYSTATDPSNLPGQFLFEYWIRYAYADDNPASLPVRDTLRGLGQYTNGAFTYVSNTSVETFTYDSEKRIVRLDATGGAPSINYTYDANGNLVLPNMTYDNKKSFRQTNKVWMLVDRNFSKNNSFTAIQYNSEGYPTLFPAPGTSTPLLNFLRRGMNMKTMDYSCTVSASPAP